MSPSLGKATRAMKKYKGSNNKCKDKKEEEQ